MIKEKIYIGTAGWSYNDWVGPFYPSAQSNSFDWLTYYSQHFNCVEVNSTYYTYISPKIVEGWIKKVEAKEEFLFTLKLHQDFTHKNKFTSANIDAVKTSIDLLNRETKFGGLLIQFPYSFQFNASNSQRLQNLTEIFSGINLFIEVRHKSWFNVSAIKELNNSFVTLCSIDQPQIGEAIPFQVFAMNRKIYVRLHGRNKNEWKKSITNFGKKQTYDEQNARYNYLYSAGELTEIVRKIKEKSGEVEEVFIITNNHPQGHAVTNAFEMMRLLEVKADEFRLK